MDLNPSEKNVLDLALDCASVIGAAGRSFEDFDEQISPQLIRHISVLAAPVDEEGNISNADALTIYQTIEELAEAGFMFDTDITWDYYDLQNEETTWVRSDFQSGKISIHKNFVQDKSTKANLVIAVGLKPPEAISTQDYNDLETSQAFARGTSAEENLRQIQRTIQRSGAGIIAARDSGISSRQLTHEDIPTIFISPEALQRDRIMPRDHNLDFSIHPEIMMDYFLYQASTLKTVLNESHPLTAAAVKGYGSAYTPARTPQT